MKTPSYSTVYVGKGLVITLDIGFLLIDAFAGTLTWATYLSEELVLSWRSDPARSTMFKRLWRGCMALSLLLIKIWKMW